MSDPPSVTNERDYIVWFVKTSPECMLLREWTTNPDNTAEVIANLCEKQQVGANTPEKLFKKLLDVSADYNDQLLPALNKRGGLANLLDMPPDLINATIQMVAQITVFKELLLKKYKHKEAVELFAMIDAPEKSRRS
jgi:hypothetical protein